MLLGPPFLKLNLIITPTIQVELDHKLKPFIPDFIPAVGDIDAFITVPRPDGQVNKLGLACIDEPCAKQSDPTVLDLQIRAITKQSTARAMQVHSIIVQYNNA